MNDKSSYKVLMVDDEPNVLSGYRRTLGRAHALTIAEGGAEGLAALKSFGPFAVVITDMGMPHMSGVEFINAARRISRDSVYMMLSGHADQQTAVDAINQGKIFRFLNKPCPPELLETATQDAIRQHELVTAERVLLRHTFAGSIKIMVEALELSNPGLFMFQTRVKHLQQRVCNGIGLRGDWQMSVAGSLCLIGLMTFPGVSAQNKLTDDMLAQATVIGSRLLSHIPRIETVVEMIRRQREPTMALPPDLQSLSPEEYQTVGAQLLRFSVDLARVELSLSDLEAAIAQLDRSGKYDPRLIGALTVQMGMPASDMPAIDETASLQKISVYLVTPGMVIATDVRHADGTLLLSKDQPISELGVASLQHLAARGVIEERIAVRVDAPVMAEAV